MTIPAGALRFNSDSGKLEYYNGEAWWQIDNFSADNATGGARGVFGGGETSPALSNVIDYITISTTGNAIDFGDLYTGRGPGATSSITRGLFFGGYAPVNSNNIHFITISSTGNSQDFGDLTVARTYPSGVSNGTRGVIGGGYSNRQSIEYVTIASTGNAISFGSLTTQKGGGAGGASSSTRGIFAGGYNPAGYLNVIDYITISTVGNAADFGDLSVARAALAGCSNSIRGVFGGGAPAPSILSNIIDYITIATTGNAIDFGDLTVARQTQQSACSSSIRGVFAGGNISPGFPVTNVIDYVTIMSVGNAIDFGDLTVARNQAGGLSNAHGGL